MTEQHNSAWPTPFPPGSAAEHRFLCRHSEPVAVASVRARTPFLVIKLDGLVALGEAVFKHYPAVLIALEAVRLQVAAKRPLRVTATVDARLGITRQERRTALTLLSELPQWFEVVGRGSRSAKLVRVTDAGVELIYRRKPA
jgi:hypothetical protein